METKATTVEQYLAEIPPERREAMRAVREVILENLGKGYEEGICSTGISYVVPHSIYPAGYHCDPSSPLPFVGLASQKNYMAVYLFCIYTDEDEADWFRKAWLKTGKKLNMGASCVRFRKLDDVALDVIGMAIKRMPATKFIAYYESSRAAAAEAAAARKKAPAKKAAKKTAKKASKKTGKKTPAKKPAAKKKTTKKSAKKTSRTVAGKR